MSEEKCRLHDVCMAQFENKLENLNLKVEALFDKLGTWEKHGERITAVEHQIAGHQKDLNGNVVKWREHEGFAKESLDKQQSRDEKMDNDIRTLSSAIQEMTTALVKSETSLRDLVDDKIEAVVSGWRKLVISAGSVLLVTCASALGTLLLLYIQTRTP